MVGPKVFEIDEVNDLIPELETIFGALGRVREKVRALKLRINALEMIWGEGVHETENPDHPELQHHLREMQSLQEEFERVSSRVPELGGQLKGLEPALVDFYGVREGHLVLWCWTQGEERIDYWHHVDEGFSGRQCV